MKKPQSIPAGVVYCHTTQVSVRPRRSVFGLLPPAVGSSSFPSIHAKKRKENRQYKVAWSNECIELWFVLHFQELAVNNGREQYQRILKQKYGYEKTLGLRNRNFYNKPVYIQRQKQYQMIAMVSKKW